MSSIFTSVKKWNQKLKLRERMVYTFTLFTLVAILLISSLFYVRFSKVFTNNTKQLIERSMDQTTDYISYRLNALKDISSEAYLDNEFKNAIREFKNEKNEPEKILKYGQLQSITKNIGIGRDISNVRLYVNDSYASVHGQSTVLQEQLIQEANWYDHVISENGAIVWIPTYTYDFSQPYGEQKVISLARVIPDSLYSSSKLGILVVDIRESILNEIIEKVSITQKGEVHLINQSGYILTSTNEDLNSTFLDFETYVGNKDRYGTRQKTLKLEDGLKTVFHQRVPNLDWQLVSVIPNDEIREGAISLFNFMAVVFVVVTTISLYFAVKISRNLTYRIEDLSSKMDQVKEDNWDIEFEKTYEDELGDLQENFHYMTEQIKQLIEKQQFAALELRDAELRTLQAQINPHFLYNILDLINWLSIKHEAHDINDIVEKLAKFFRISLSSGKEYIKLTQELEHIKLYVDIQNKRFENKIGLQLNVEEEILDYYTINLLMQPLVENAILHGISEKEGKTGTITIDAYQDLGSITIEISDDGVGMSEHEISQILSYSNKDAYGVKNVNERLSLRFGPMYGLSYISEKGIGTTATIRIPVLKTIEDVSNEGDN